MRRLTLFALIGALGFGLLGTGCGGSGNGPTEPSLPGVLRIVALEGNPAPGSGGNFLAMPLKPVMDVIAGGWAVFVAPTSGATKTEVLYAVQPDSALVEVFAVGDTVPNAGGGTISAIRWARVRAAGLILAYVEIAGDGGGRTWGVLSAQVSAGAATNKTDVVYHMDVVAPAVGTVDSIAYETALVAAGGRYFFFADMSGGDTVLLSLTATGTSPVRVVGTTDPLPGAATVAALVAFGIDVDGGQIAFVADVGGGVLRLYVAALGNPLFTEIFRENEVLPVESGGGTVVDAYSAGPILVYPAGTVFWMARGSLAAPDDIFMVGNTTPTKQVIARSGIAAPSINGGTYGALTMLQQALNVISPEFGAEVFGSPISFAIYATQSSIEPPVLVVWEGRSAPVSAGGGQFGDIFPGIASPCYTEVAANASFLFANVLSTGATGLFWIFQTAGPFTVAVEGGSVPGGGDTFGSFNPSAHTVASDSALFRAAFTSGLTAILRQGP